MAGKKNIAADVSVLTFAPMKINDITDKNKPKQDELVPADFHTILN